MAIVEKIKAATKKKGVTMNQVTLAWLMAQWEDVIPIPGTPWICEDQAGEKRDQGD